jgi:hypothetical protein
MRTDARRLFRAFDIAARDSVISFAAAWRLLCDAGCLLYAVALNCKAVNRVYSVADKTIVGSVEFDRAHWLILFLMKVFGRKSDDKQAQGNLAFGRREREREREKIEITVEFASYMLPSAINNHSIILSSLRVLYACIICRDLHSRLRNAQGTE